MKINRDSMIYRSYMMMADNEPRDLCTFMRRFIIQKLLQIGLGAFFIGLLAMPTVLTIAVAINSLITGVPFILDTFVMAALATWIIVLGIASIFLVVHLFKVARAKYRASRKLTGDEVPAQPNVFVQWARDKHNKICTFIDYD